MAEQSRVIITSGILRVCSTLDIWSSPCELYSISVLQNSTLVIPSFRGPTATAFLEWITPSSLSSLNPYTSTLSVILNEKGGIIDDTVITKHAQDAFYVVTNAGRRDRDLPWFQEKLSEWNSGENGKEGPVELEILDGWGLLALQGKFFSGLVRSQSPRLTCLMAGPEAAEYLQSLTSYDLQELTFGKSAFVPMEGFNLHVARGGYTGEDGFEVISTFYFPISIKPEAYFLDLNTAVSNSRGSETFVEIARTAHRPRGARQSSSRSRYVSLWQ